MLPIPLLREFHIESAILAGTVGAFIGGWRATKPHARYHLKMGVRIVWQTALFGLPLLVLSLINQCLSLDGVGFWLLIPAPSIYFGIAVGRFFRKLSFPFPRISMLLVLLFVGLGILLIETLNLPQIYYFNHLWGYWPGPIYDEEVLFPISLLYFRIITLVWIWLLWMLPVWWKTRNQKKRTAFAVFLILLSFYFRPELGINSPESLLQQKLKAVEETEHFRLFFDPELYTEKERAYWTDRHEFHFSQIEEILEIDWPKGRKINSYLYGNAWQKKKLVGAKFTSYVPVWLKQDQLHIAKEHLEGVLKHELVHVIAKQFGNDLTNASYSIGLVEGLAEGIAADASDVSTLDQIMAAEQPFPTANDMRNALTFRGFYSKAGSISYTTAGSFVQYLLDNYPVENLKQAYRESSFKNAYSTPFETLVQEWQAHLPVSSIDSLDSETSKIIFSQQAIFKASCPHTLSPTRKQWDNIIRHERSNDSTAALTELRSLIEKRPDHPMIKQKWADYELSIGSPRAVITKFKDDDSLAVFSLMKADALLLSGNIVAAQMLYDQIRSFADTSNVTLQESLDVRSTPFFWNTYVNVRYKYRLPALDHFEELPSALQWLTIIRALEHWRDEKLIGYTTILRPSASNSTWFDVQLSTIDRLAFIGQNELASDWLDALENPNLRERYKERVREKREWLQFLSE